MFSLLDGFSGYNQVLIAEPNWLKTTFRTKWGTLAYRRMPFGLINIGATFKREMDIACNVPQLNLGTLLAENTHKYKNFLLTKFPVAY